MQHAGDRPHLEFEQISFSRHKELTAVGAAAAFPPTQIAVAAGSPSPASDLSPLPFPHGSAASQSADPSQHHNQICQLTRLRIPHNRSPTGCR